MCPDFNQPPEQVARDCIDECLRASGWLVQDKDALDFNAGLGVAVREYPTDIGPADYVLFADRQAVGVVEAKPVDWGVRLTSVEEQSEGYAKAKLKWVTNAEPLPFLYESTGQITRFTNAYDPSPRSREVFTFHRPETLKSWAQAPKSLRAGIAALPGLNPDGLRDCQIKAITKLEASLKAGKPRALVQVATGSGKTFTAITQVYRLLKHAGARRILFLVDTRNVGEQAEQEFIAFIPNDDKRPAKPRRDAKPPHVRDVGVPAGFDWTSLTSRRGAELEAHYVVLLRKLREQKGMLGQIFTKAQNKMTDPAKLLRLIDMVDSTTWVRLDADVKGDIYEGLLERNAEDTKSGAGQYFTPRALIRAMVEFIRPEPGKTIADPACGTGGFFLAAHDFLTDTDNLALDKDQKAFLKHSTFFGNEIVAGTRRLCLMNMFLHGIGEMTGDTLVSPADALISPPSETFDYVLACVTSAPVGRN